MEPRLPSESGNDELDVDRALLKSALAGRLFGAPEASIQLGRFRVLRRLGHGGMGVVYDALDLERDCRVALKVLGEVDGRAIYHLKREFRALCDVVHPSLVSLHELFYEQGQWFFTMELVDGVGFNHWVRGGSGCDEARLRAALRELALAVQAIHAAGKLHCDLKPSNVLVTAQGRVVLLDFGLVGEQSGRMQALRSGLAGTPAYVAPEQAAGGEPSEASDWYALGVMLFEALTGQLPFSGIPLRVLADKQQQVAPDPNTLAPGLPADLCALCSGLLRREPAQRLGAEHVLRCLSTHAPAVVAAAALASAPPLLVGRDAELAVLVQALEQTRAGAPVRVLVAGRSGMGKTALLDHFADIADTRGLLLRGRCHEAESVPYKAFDWVVDALSQYMRTLSDHDLFGLVPRHVEALLQVFPVLGQVPALAAVAAARTSTGDARKVRNQCFAALKELLLCLTDRLPVTIVVDDLQWADLDSARLLEHLLGAPEPPPLLLVGAYRDDEVMRSDFLRAMLDSDALAGHVQSHRLALGPLPPLAATELARKLLGTQAELAASIAAEAKGVPLFIAQLAQSQGQCPQRVQPGGQPISLEQVVLQRVERLPDDARRLLCVLSVAMGPLEQAVANDAAQLPAGDRSPLLSLRAERMIRTRGAPGDSVETYHDRIRETVVSSISAATRSEIHAAIVRAMERNHVSDPERLLPHLAGAGDPLGAGRSALAAARLAVQKLAFNRAAALFTQAIELLPEDEICSSDVRAQLASALADSGRGVQAAAAYLQAAQGLPAAQAHKMACMAAQQYLRSGRNDEGLALMRSTLGAVGIELPESRFVCYTRMMAAHLALRVRGLHLARDPRPLSPAASERLSTLSELFPELITIEALAGSLLQTYCLREALDAGDAARSLQGLVWEAITTAILGGASNQRRAARVLREVQPLADRLATPYAQAMAQLAQAGCMLGTGNQFRDAMGPALAALELFGRCPGAFWERACVSYTVLTCLEWMQDLSEVSRRGEALLSEANERDDRFGAVVTTMAATYSYLMRDDPDAALALLERHHAWLPQNYTNMRYLWLVRSIETLCYAGAARQGLAMIEREWPALKRSFLYGCQVVRSTATTCAARCALAVYLDSRDPAERARARRWLKPFVLAGSLFEAYERALQATLDAAEGRRAGAIAGLRASQAGFEACQTGFGVYCERMLCELHDDAAGVARIDGQLRARGVVNPARWAANHLPRARSDAVGRAR